MKIQHFLALVVLSLATVPGARAAVLAGPITNAANAHTYYLLSSNTWTASEAEAVGLGGHLATINDAAENQWVLNTFFPLTGVPYASLWIGLNDAANEGQFVWANGEPVTFTYWYPGEPNNLGLGGEDYATIRHPSEAPPTGSWNDLANTPSAPTFGVVEVPTPLPVAVTQPADLFTPGSARLNGQANPNGSPTLAWFEWGTSPAYGNVTPPQSVGSGSNVVVGFSNVLVGLVNGTDYHFRARASNAFGSLAGLDQTFNLSNQRPVVTTLAADPLTTNSARLRGQVNPRGSPTAAWFEWGTDTNYGNVIGMQDVGQGSSVSNLNVVLDGLTTGTNYHYRLVATNAFGAGSGADQTFNPAQRPPTTITWTGADPSGYWSAPANWSPAGVLANGDDLVFPGGLPPGDMVSTNDLTDSFFRKITFSGAGGHTIRGNLITLTNVAPVITCSRTNVIACDLVLSAAVSPSTPYWQWPSIWSSYPSELTLSGNIVGSNLNSSASRLVISGEFPGGRIYTYGGTVVFYGDHLHALFATNQGGTFFVQGSQPNLNLTMLWEMESAACGSLSGAGSVGDIMGCGHFVLDSTLSVKNLVPATGYWRVLDIKLNGTNVGEYGRLVASADVNLTGGSLSPSAGFNPQAGQIYTIVEKTSPGLIANEFLGPEGTVTTLKGMPFRLSYFGGDGNDVTLTAQSANAVPTITWVQPNDGATFRLPVSISLGARATDSDGTVSFVDFFATPSNGPPINVGRGTLATPDGLYVKEWTNPPAGQYRLHAEAVDNAGGRAISDSVQITVKIFSDANWSPLSNGLGNGNAYALAVSGSSLYAGGSFTMAGGTPANRIAKWNETNWSSLGSGVELGSEPPGVNPTVYALAVSGGDLYVGGLFKRAGGSPITNIAKWNGTNWSAVGLGFSGTAFDRVSALAASGKDIYAGGVFGIAGGNPANFIAKWNGTNWSALGSGMDATVFALAVSGTDLYAGGFFSTAGGTPAKFIARWNGTNWSALGSGMDATVFALAVSGTNLYAAGDFTNAGGIPAKHVAKWDGTSWSALGSGMGTNFPTVAALAASGGDLYAGGRFMTAGGSPANWIAKWDGINWSALGSGMNNNVDALAVSGTHLYAGGRFTTAGNKPSAKVAKARIGSAAESIIAFGTSVTVQFSGVVGYEYHVQRTDSLTAPMTWITLTTTPLSPAASGSFSFIDTNAPPGTVYYRLVQN